MLLNTAGPEVIVPLDPSRSVYPSALAFATAAVPIRPPAPLRFSTRTCAPSASENAGATVRAVISTLPLGGQGTTIFTVRVGKSWAKAHAAATIARTGIHRVIIALPGRSEDAIFAYRRGFVGICGLCFCLRRGAEGDPAGLIGEFQHACSRKGQSFLAARVHELPEDQGIPHQERRGLRVDQRARQSGRDGRAAQARRAQRPGRRARRQVRVRAGPRRRHRVPRSEGAGAGTAEPGRAGEEARARAPRRVPVHPADPGGVARQALSQPQPADPRADLRAHHEGSARASLRRGHRALRRERPRAASGMVENLSGPQLLARDGHLLRQAPPARGAGAHRLASGAAHAPADADSRNAENRARPQAHGARPRGTTPARQGLGRRKGGSMRKGLIALLALLAFGAHAQQRNFDAVQIKTTQVAPGIYMLEGEGGNIGVSAGEDGVFLIDDQFAPLTPKIVAAVAAISDKPIRFLMNTHWHGDHVGGNENLGKAGVVIIAHDNVYKRMSVGGAITALKQNYAPAPRAALPVVTFNQTATFRLNGDDITSTHLTPAHTDGDSFVRFAKANVIHTGDVFAAYRYPFIDPESGGSVKGVLRAIDQMLPLLDDNTKLIPGHGGLSSKKDVLAYRKMVSTAISKIEPMVKSGRTLQQVIDAKPLREFDEQWGKFRKPEAFVEIVYNGLRRK